MKFAEIVRSSPALRTTFDGVSGFSLWWRIVLALHGKPRSENIDESVKVRVLVKGFRFYGYLYLGLGAFILALFGAFAWMGAFPSPYWALLTAFFGTFLVASSQLAFAGARLFVGDPRRGSVLLVCFFVAVIIFLSAFGLVASIAASERGFLTDLPNIGLYALFIALGIGSYFIELIYLLWHRP